MGTPSPSPWDLTLSSQNVRGDRAAAAALHSGTWVGALVASLRCRVLRPSKETVSEPRKERLTEGF
jgi:hypothetical protein